MAHRHEASFCAWLAADEEVKSFSDVEDNVAAELSEYMDTWSYKEMDDCIWLYLLSFDCIPVVACCIQLCSNMQICVFVNGSRIQDSRLAWVWGRTVSSSVGLSLKICRVAIRMQTADCTVI